MWRYRLLFSILVGIFLSITACTQFVLRDQELISPPPSLQLAAPRLLSFTVNPSQIFAGRISTVQMGLEYEDWNEDVGPTQAKVRLSFQRLSGNLALDQREGLFLSRVESQGRVGKVFLAFNMNISFGASGRLLIKASLYDEANKLSSILSTELNIL